MESGIQSYDGRGRQRNAEIESERNEVEEEQKWEDYLSLYLSVSMAILHSLLA